MFTVSQKMLNLHNLIEILLDSGFTYENIAHKYLEKNKLELKTDFGDLLKNEVLLRKAKNFLSPYPFYGSRNSSLEVIAKILLCDETPVYDSDIVSMIIFLILLKEEQYED